MTEYAPDPNQEPRLANQRPDVLLLGMGSGASEFRPVVSAPGIAFFDTTLGKPIWWSGTEWVDATGAAVDNEEGGEPA